MLSGWECVLFKTVHNTIEVYRVLNPVDIGKYRIPSQSCFCRRVDQYSGLVRRLWDPNTSMSNILSKHHTNRNSPGLCSGIDNSTQPHQLQTSRPSFRICKFEMSNDVPHCSTKSPTPRSRIIPRYTVTHNVNNVKYSPHSTVRVDLSIPRHRIPRSP